MGSNEKQVKGEIDVQYHVVHSNRSNFSIEKSRMR